MEILFLENMYIEKCQAANEAWKLYRKFVDTSRLTLCKDTCIKEMELYCSANDATKDMMAAFQLLKRS